MTDTDSDPREYLRRDFKHKISGGIYTLFGINKTRHGTIRVRAADKEGNTCKMSWEEFLRQFEVTE